MNWKTLGTLAVAAPIAIGAMVLVLFGANGCGPGPALQWQPRSVGAVVTRGEVTEIELLLEARMDVSDILVALDGGLEEVATIAPGTVPELMRGYEAQLLLRVDVPSDYGSAEINGVLDADCTSAASETRSRLPVQLQVWTHESVGPLRFKRPLDWTVSSAEEISGDTTIVLRGGQGAAIAMTLPMPFAPPVTRLVGR